VDLSFVRLNNVNQEIRAKSLCSNSSLITAIGNDLGFEYIFSHQIRRQAKPGDICFAISASGNSPNLIRAFEACDKKSVHKIALLGFDGGSLLSMANIAVLIPTRDGMYGPVEDVHLSICHYLASTLKHDVFGDR
jgi:D-sedoheptulose 7-phosphate isomerase